MTTPTYSFVVPHHNIPTLLERCLSSIPCRDDVEVIVVDDHSSAETVGRLQAMESAHPHATFVYLSENGGGGRARNEGLRHARGRYVIFADADDFFNDCLPDVLDDYAAATYDMVFFKGTSVDTDTLAPAHRADHLNRYADAFLQGQDPGGQQLRFLFGEPWGRMVSRDLIERCHIRFEETTIHNDTAFAYLTGYHASSIHADERRLYCVTVRQGSVSVTDSADRILTRVAVFGRAELFLTARHVATQPDAHYDQLTRLLAHGRLRLLRQAFGVLWSQGFSRRHVYARTAKKLFSNICKRLSKKTSS